MSSPFAAPGVRSRDRHDTCLFLCSACIYDRIPPFYASPFLQDAPILACWTIIRAPIPLNDSADQGTAPSARFAFSLKNLQIILILSGSPFRIHEIRKAGSPPLDGLGQYPLYGAGKPVRLPGNERTASSLGMNARQEQCFACINVPQPGNNSLVKKECLDLLPTGSQLRFQPPAFKSGAQRILSQTVKFGNLLQTQVFINSHETKPARIPVL